MAAPAAPVARYHVLDGGLRLWKLDMSTEAVYQHLKHRGKQDVASSQNLKMQLLGDIKSSERPTQPEVQAAAAVLLTPAAFLRFKRNLLVVAKWLQTVFPDLVMIGLHKHDEEPYERFLVLLKKDTDPQDFVKALAALADNLPIQVEYFTDLLVVVKPR